MRQTAALAGRVVRPLLRLEVVPFEDVPPAVYTLTRPSEVWYGADGRQHEKGSWMRMLLNRTPRPVGRAILGYAAGIPVGWSIAIPNTFYMQNADGDIVRRWVAAIAVFVAQAHRQRGYGVELVRAARTFAPQHMECWAMPDDEAGRRTFIKGGVLWQQR